jgi:hypothetical protein
MVSIFLIVESLGVIQQIIVEFFPDFETTDERRNLDFRYQE